MWMQNTLVCVDVITNNRMGWFNIRIICIIWHWIWFACKCLLKYVVFFSLSLLCYCAVVAAHHHFSVNESVYVYNRMLMPKQGSRKNNSNLTTIYDLYTNMSKTHFIQQRTTAFFFLIGYDQNYTATAKKKARWKKITMQIRWVKSFSFHRRCLANCFSHCFFFRFASKNNWEPSENWSVCVLQMQHIQNGRGRQVAVRTKCSSG